MTKSEGQRLVAMLAAAWPRMEIQQATLEVYAMALGDLDYDLAKDAVQRLLQTSRFFPTVAEIREAAVKGKVALPTAEEAWGLVRRAIGRHGSYRVPVFDCDEVQQAVDAIGWKDICLSETPAATRARWLDAFKAFAARRMEAEATGRYRPADRQLPPRNEVERELGDTRVLVETGYPSPATSPPALPPGTRDETPALLVGAVTSALARRGGQR